MASRLLRDYPPKSDLLTEIYRPLPSVQASLRIERADAGSIASNLLRDFSSILDSGDNERLPSLFFDEQAYFRDTVAFTYHIRTFKDKSSIVPALVKLNNVRRASGFEVVPNSAQYVTIGETLAWLDFFFAFRTSSPSATCGGRMMLLPQVGGEGLTTWKIWTLSTWLTGFEEFPEDETLLREPCETSLKTQRDLRTDVIIIGGGNSGLITAARLKALGLKFVIVDEGANVGDNWASRYDFLRFHIPKSACETPYLAYSDDASDPLTRDDLAEQMRRFAAAFDLRVFHQTTLKATKFDAVAKWWTINLFSPTGEKTVFAKHLVLATGSGSWAPHIPDIKGLGRFKGINVHSAGGYKNAKLLANQGVNSVVVVGSANTGFDIIEDCYNAGLQTTMLQRSPTYLIPMKYLYHPGGFGVFDHVPVDVGDAMVIGGPVAVGGQLVGILHANLAAAEPNLYAELKNTSFQVLDSTAADLTSNLYERGGCHFVDMGHGVELLATRKVGIRSGIYPTAYTETGLRLSDGSALDADAIVWCTGFRDLDMREVIPEVMGEGGEDIRDRMDAVWSLDAEGELRGIFKRHENVENFWIVGHGTLHQRWYSKLVAMQIKAAIEGFLPEAYRETP